MEWPGKCEECDGKGERVSRTSLLRGGPVENYIILCAFCGGSGERDLTADEATKYIWETGHEWDASFFDAWYITVYDRETQGEKFSKQIRIESYTQALNAAARAIAG